MRVINPCAIAEPAGAYSHAIEVSSRARLLYISGQIGMRSDGGVPEGIEVQAEQVWSNIESILTDAGMVVGDLIKITSLITRVDDFPVYAAVRARHLGLSRPASTSFVVNALVKADWLIEVEAVAAKE